MVRPHGLKSLVLLPLFWCALLVAAASTPGIASQVNPYTTRQFHDPNGIGKFYMGREIARVMGHEAAEWLERAERDRQERPEKLVEVLQLKEGQVVADIGAGTGYLTRRLAKKAGANGKVFAVDIQPQMLHQLTSRMALAGTSNVVCVLGTATDARLARETVDLAVLVDVYHEFEFPKEMMESICQALKPGARVALVEYRAEDGSVPIKAVHKMSEAQVRKEMSLMPLEWVETIRTLPWQHVIVFRKRS